MRQQLRMDWKARHPHEYAMHFNGRTSPVSTFRTLFPRELRFEGNRSIVFQADDNVPRDALPTCIRAALTYHRPPSPPHAV